MIRASLVGGISKADLREGLREFRSDIREELQAELKPIKNRLMQIERDVKTLKIQGDRNEVAIRELRDDVKDLQHDMKWLKRSQGWQEPPHLKPVK